MPFRKLVSLLSATWVLIISGCTQKENYILFQSKETRHTLTEKTDFLKREYRIQKHDRLKIILYRDVGQLSIDQITNVGEEVVPGGALVDAKGYVTLPLIGRIKVANLTQTQAAKKMEKLYKEQLTDPSVYVEALNKRITILGEVHKQGIIPLDKEKMNLIEAIGHAGGLTDFAVRESIVIMSPDQFGKLQMRTVDLTRFDPKALHHHMLYPGDIVYVKPNNMKQYRVAAQEYTLPFETVSKIASPFVTLKILSQ